MQAVGFDAIDSELFHARERSWQILIQLVPERVELHGELAFVARGDRRSGFSRRSSVIRMCLRVARATSEDQQQRGRAKTEGVSNSHAVSSCGARGMCRTGG